MQPPAQRLGFQLIRASRKENMPQYAELDLDKIQGSEVQIKDYNSIKDLIIGV